MVQEYRGGKDNNSEKRQGALGKCVLNCKHLKEVVFEEGSKLETIGAKCFCRSGIKEIVLPASVKEVSADAF